MEVRSSVEDCAADGNADGAAEIPHHVEKSACVFQPLRWQAGEAEVHGWRNRENLWQTSQDLRDQELIRAPVVSNEAVTPHCQPEGRQPEHHQPADVEL